MSILRDEGPEFRPLIFGLSADDKSMLLGQRAGFAEHHQRLEEMAERWPIRGVQPQETYAEEKEEPDA